MRTPISLPVLLLLIATAPAAPADPAASAIVAVDDIRIHYLDLGQQHAGVPVLLMHGAFGSTRLWEPVGRQLAACRRAIVPDARGRGRTSDGDGPLTPGRLARDAVGLLDRLGIGRAHVVGHSAGSLVLLSMMIDYPERVASAVLVGSPAMGLATPGPALRELQEDIQRLAAGRTPTDATLLEFRDRWRAEAPDPAGFERVMGKLAFGARAAPDPGAAAGRAPALVVRAGRDPLIPAEISTALARRLGTDAVLEAPDGTHALPRQHPLALASELDAFFGRVDGQRCAALRPEPGAGPAAVFLVALPR